MYKKQHTLAQPIMYSGLGLHYGEECEVHVLPAEQNTGVKFHVMDNWECREEFAANISNVVSGDFRTELGTAHYKISTVEHLLAAISGANIDNCIIKVWGKEVPAADGSSKIWTCLINDAGLVEQVADRGYIKILKPILAREDDAWCALAPIQNDLFSISYTIDYDHPLIGIKSQVVNLDSHTFEQDISPSRTFGFLKDLDLYKRYGLAKGASFENTLVFDNEVIANSDKCMRMTNEPLMHKILDVIGDLSLVSRPIIGKFVGYKSGHSLNQQLVKELLNNQDCWKICKVENNVKHEMLA